MINLEILQPASKYTTDHVDPFNEFDAITIGLRQFMRENNHNVQLSQGKTTKDILFDPDLICFVESFPGDYFESISLEKSTIDITNWPIILFVKNINNSFECRFNFSESSDLLTATQFKELLWGFANKIAVMAREKGYLTEEQVAQFLTGKWW